MKESIINYYGKQDSRCGYCKGTNCSISHGMHAFNLLPGDYQDLIDRGWRRSGNYCYKLDNKTTCCPCYTIKCDALEFKLSKSHKKILKRMSRFLRDGKKDKNEEQDIGMDNAVAEEEGVEDMGIGLGEEPKEPNLPLPDVDLAAVAAANPGRGAVANKIDDQTTQVAKQQLSTEAENPSVETFQFSQDHLKSSLDASRLPSKKAKQLRMERKIAKLSAKGNLNSVMLQSKAPKKQPNQEKTLQDYFEEGIATDKHKLKLSLVHVKSMQFRETKALSYKLYLKYQTHIHNDPPDCENDYLVFLQQSPLMYLRTHDGPSTGYGSFHHQYWLDDKLIAVGVIDILPHCVSSVYFFYDPDYSFLSLGTYGSLREIAYVQELAKKLPALRYYYMGFYIHSCPKMRYKGKLVPSYLLCPEAYTWHLLTDAIRTKLDEHKYQRFNDDTNARDVDEFEEGHLDGVQLLIKNCVIPYRQYIQSFNIQTIDNMLDIIRSRLYKEFTGDNDDRDSILEYGKLVGKSCAHRIIYLLNA